MAGRSPLTVRDGAVDDADALGLITVSASLGTFIGSIPEERLDLGWRPEDSASGWRDVLSDLRADEVFLVAETERRVVGFTWAALAPDLGTGGGEIKGLYVRPTAQGRGAGRLLVTRGAERLLRLGASRLFIGCIEENPSCGFYERLGGTEVRRRPAVVDRHRTEEIIFHWPDITDLI